MKNEQFSLLEKPSFINKIIDKKELKKIISWAFSDYGVSKSSYMADKLKELGFHYATKAGISISIEDLRVPPNKRHLISLTNKEIEVTEQKYLRGEITAIEKLQKTIDTWNIASESLKDEVIMYFKDTDPLNPVYIMSFSGARGNISQVKQLVGMRGLMSDPHGEIIDLPIKSNFREGLTVTEYIISCYGARKGLVDTALRTADSGYLTRRLVDVAQDIVVRELECNTTYAILLKELTDNAKIVVQLKDRLIGRTTFETLYSPDSSIELVQKNQAINSAEAKKIVDLGITSVLIRSPLTCIASRSVCQLCYGWNLAHRYLVDLGEAVGIIAAQSIGEPGTQLTMRTFHTGGVFTGELANYIKAPCDGILKLLYPLKAKLIRTKHGNEAFLIDQPLKVYIYDFTSKRIVFTLQSGSILFLSDNQEIKKGEIIGEILSKKSLSTEKVTKDLLTTISGKVYLSNPYRKKNRKLEKTKGNKKKRKKQNRDIITKSETLIWILKGDVYTITPNTTLLVKKGDQINTNEAIAVLETKSEYGGIVELNKHYRDKIDIISASTTIENAVILTNTDPNTYEISYTLQFEDKKNFLLDCYPGDKIANKQIIGELVDDSYLTSMGGFIKYIDSDLMKIKNANTDTQELLIYWVPEETYEVYKKKSLLLLSDKTMIEKDEEIIKNLRSLNAGFLSIREENGIVKEICIKPGYLKAIKSPASITPKFFEPGDQIGNIFIESTSFVEVIEKNNEKFLLIRPVTKYTIKQDHTYLNQTLFNDGKTILKVSTEYIKTVKDGERIKSRKPINLLRVHLILNITSERPYLCADIEFLKTNSESKNKLKFAIIENLILRQNIFDEIEPKSVLTKVIVTNGSVIAPKTIVAKTTLICKSGGTVEDVSTNKKQIQSILIFSEDHKEIIDTNGETIQAYEGALVQSGDRLSKSLVSPVSGQIIKISKTKVIIRPGNSYLISPGSILQIDNLNLIRIGDPLATLMFERQKTEDIIQGLPKIEEILEARKTKESCYLAEASGLIKISMYSHDTGLIKITEDNGDLDEHIIQSNYKFITTNGEIVLLGEPITDGPISPHKMLNTFFNSYKKSFNLYDATNLSLQKVQVYIVNEVQSVYQSQNVDISDKHVEIIVRQMTSKVLVNDGGDTTLLPGEILELQQVLDVNKSMNETKGSEASYSPILLGITKASLKTDSFISAASFQETTRVLTRAAIEGKADWLRGLKENVIIGSLIPAGTGFIASLEDMELTTEEKSSPSQPQDASDENDTKETNHDTNS